MSIIIKAKVLKNILDWVEDQAENLTTTEININFFKSELEVYDYETGVTHSSRPLNYFED